MSAAIDSGWDDEASTQEDVTSVYGDRTEYTLSLTFADHVRTFRVRGFVDLARCIDRISQTYPEARVAIGERE